jgi:dTDP-4-dehydrorhamnose 3,5-epimerase
VQDNESSSTRGVLRGLHYQVEQPQGKLVRVVDGEIYDVAVDLRRSSPTCGKWFGITLSSDNKQQLWVPVGFALGFLTVSETVIVAYKATDFYCQQGERAILWDDPDLGIDWPLDTAPELSDKDKAATLFRDADTFE